MQISASRNFTDWRQERNALYLNDGTGNFSDSGQQLSNARSNGMALGDVDGDGDLDLIEATDSGSRLRLNDGSGDFSAGSTTLSSDILYNVALVDVDGDGDLDLVEANYSGPNRVLLNDGSGNFSDSGQALGDSITTSVALGDLDGDGDLDLVAGNYTQPDKVWINGALPVELSVSASSGSEAAQTMITVTATAAGNVLSDQSVDLQVSGTGITTGDYSLSANQIQIAAGSASGSVTFSVIDDALVEGPETATISISGYSVMLAPGPVISRDILIGDSDGLPVLSALAIAPSSFSENGGGAVITGTIVSASLSDGCFDLGFSGTATPETDYSVSDDGAGSAGTQLCVAAGDSMGTVDLTGIDDALFEGDEGLTISSGGQMANATISDDETAPMITALAIAPGSFGENGGIAVLSATVSGTSASDTCFDLSFTGVATLGDDYSSDDDDAGTAGTQVCVAAGDTSGTLDLAGIDDAVFEGDEALTASSGGQVASATVSDNETAPVLTALAIAPGSFGENAGVAVLTATVSNPSTMSTCFDVGFAGAATFGVDYSSSDDDAGTAGTQLCVAAGDSSGTLELTGIDDAVFEGDESISASSGSAMASSTLTDAEDTPTLTTLLFDPAIASENGGVSLLLLFQSKLAAAPLCYTVVFSGSAEIGVDYNIFDDDDAAGTQLCVAAGEFGYPALRASGRTHCRACVGCAGRPAGRAHRVADCCNAGSAGGNRDH